MARTAEAKRHLSRLVALGCIVCGGAAEIHHPRGAAFETGTGLKADDRDALPLCHRHHRTGGYGIAYHAGEKEWERRFGTQEELLAQVQAELVIS